MIQLSKYVVQQQAEVIATLLRADGALRIYSGDQPDITTRTEGRLVSCPVTEVIVEGGTLTIKWDSATVTKEGNADYFRLVSGNIPVLSGKIGSSDEDDSEMQMTDRELKIGTIVDAGILVHSVFKQ